MFTSSKVGPAVKTEKGSKKPVGGGDREVIKLVTASHPPRSPSYGVHPATRTDFLAYIRGYGMRIAWRGAAEKGEETRSGMRPRGGSPPNASLLHSALGSRGWATVARQRSGRCHEP